VRESLRERAILLRVAPGLVRLVPFLIPVRADTSRRPLALRAGLGLYALLAAPGPGAAFGTVPREQWDGLDGLRTDGLQQVFRYHDAATDDAALTRAVMRSAEELGARLHAPAELVAARREDHGYRVTVREGEQLRELTASTLVNAAGPWVERVRERVTPGPAGFAVDLVAGTHIELPGKVERGYYYTEAPDDRRAVFVMPWKDRTLVGTTERVHHDDPGDCEATPEEVEYLLRTLRHHFPGRDATVLEAWSGLRVLPRAEGAAFGRSRETVFRTDGPGLERYLAIYGGKLTGYRATAQKVLRRLAPALPERRPLARTCELRLC
jgi:glycerol-3-phosphate dehydrogenase